MKIQEIKEETEYEPVVKVRFKHLSAWLRIAIIGGWFALGLYFIYFLIGFLEGI